MNVLFTGDIVGPDAVDYLVERLPELRRNHRLDLVIANGDNVAISGHTPMGGSGMSSALIERLLQNGVDVVTSGTHAWDSPESVRVMALPKVIRAENLSKPPGRGHLSLEVAGEILTIVNLTRTPLASAAEDAYMTWRQLNLPGTVLVHFVGAPHDVRIFAYAVDGEAAVVLGTLGHEATLHHYHLPNGTALVPDVGMVGPRGGIGGFDPEHFMATMAGQPVSTLAPYTLSVSDLSLDAVKLELHGGRCLSVIRVA